MKNLQAKLTVLFLAFIMATTVSFAQSNCSPLKGAENEGFISAKLSEVFGKSSKNCDASCCDYQITIQNLAATDPFCPGSDITVTADPYFCGWCFPNQGCLFVSVILQNSTSSTVISNGPYSPGNGNSITAPTPDCWVCDGTETITYQIYDACCGMFFSETIAVDCNCCGDLLDCEAIEVTNVSSSGMSFSFDPVTNLECCEDPYYNLGWRLADSGNPWNYGGTWVSGNGTGGFFSLDPCTKYEFIVELKCDGVWTGETIESCTGEFQTTGWNCDKAEVPSDQYRRASLNRPVLSPNPFTDEVRISYEVESSQNVLINVFDISGRNVQTLVNEIQASGKYTVKWNAEDQAGKRLGNGTYLVMIQKGDAIFTEKLVLTR